MAGSPPSPPRTRRLRGSCPILVVDAQGYVWLGIQSGAVLMRFSTAEMDRIEKEPGHRLAYTLYDENDGLQPGTQMWQNAAAGVRDLTGRIWVVDGAGMSIIDPGCCARRAVPRLRISTR
jgi:hypothetical protein